MISCISITIHSFKEDIFHITFQYLTDETFREHIEVFLSPNPTTEELLVAGERALLIVLGEKDANTLDESRYRKFMKKCGNQVTN